MSQYCHLRPCGGCKEIRIAAARGAIVPYAYMNMKSSMMVVKICGTFPSEDATVDLSPGLVP